MCNTFTIINLQISIQSQVHEILCLACHGHMHMMGAEYSVWSIDIDAVQDSLPYMKITVAKNAKSM